MFVSSYMNVGIYTPDSLNSQVLFTYASCFSKLALIWIPDSNCSPEGFFSLTYMPIKLNWREKWVKRKLIIGLVDRGKSFSSSVSPAACTYTSGGVPPTGNTQATAASSFTREVVTRNKQTLQVQQLTSWWVAASVWLYSLTERVRGNTPDRGMWLVTWDVCMWVCVLVCVFVTETKRQRGEERILHTVQT